MRRNRDRGRPPVRIHAFQHETVVVQDGENRIPPARHAAERGTFHDLRHVHRKPGGKAQCRRQRGEYAGVARPPRDDHIDIRLQRCPKRAGAHLPDDIGGVAHVLFGQRRHVVQTADASVAHRGQQHLPVGVGRDHRHPERKTVRPGDVPDNLQRRIQMRFRTSRPSRSNDQRNIQRTRPMQHLAQVAARGLRRSRHLPLAQIGRADIDRPHVAADHVRLARKPGIEGRRRHAIAQLPGRAQKPQRTAIGPDFAQNAARGAHISIPSKGACCCAP